MGTMVGIDVSKWQRKIDWKTVAKDIDFAFIRCGYLNTDGTLTEDDYFRVNMEQAAAAGVPVGVYVYSYVNKANAAKGAARVLEAVKPYRLEMPLVFDFEDEKYKANTKDHNAEIVRDVLTVWEAAGYYSMWYTYKYFACSHIAADKLQQFDFWLAHYTAQTDYNRAFGVWQYSSKGRLSGISGDVDMNIAYKDYPGIIRAAGLNRLGKVDIVFDDLTAAAAAEIRTFADAAGIPYSVRNGG